MASFESPKFPELRVSGAGKFSGGKLDADGDAAEIVRRLVGGEFGIVETTPEEKQAPRRGRQRKTDSK